MSEKQVSKKQVSKKQVSFEEIEQRLSSVETKVGAIGRILSKVKAFIEKMYKFDIDGDGNIGKMAIALICVGLLIPMVSFAEIGSEFGDKANWRNSAIRSNGDFDTEGGIVAAGDIVTSGTIAATGNSSHSVTNGSVLTLTAGMNYITPSGMANGETNTITISSAAGGEMLIIVSSSATNALLIADGASRYLAGDFIGSATDTLSIYMVSGAGTVFETSRSNN